MRWRHSPPAKCVIRCTSGSWLSRRWRPSRPFRAPTGSRKMCLSDTRHPQRTVFGQHRPSRRDGQVAGGSKDGPGWAAAGVESSDGESFDLHLSTLAAAVMARQSPMVSSASKATTEDWRLLLGVPVRTTINETESGPTTAVLVGPVLLSSLELTKALNRVHASVGAHGVVALVALADGQNSGQVLTRSLVEPSSTLHADDAGVAFDQVAPFLRNGTGATLYDTPDGQRVSLAYAPLNVEGLEWWVIVEQPWHELVGPVLRYSQFVPLVAALAVVVSLLTLYYGIRSIVQPLRALGQRAERVAWGDFDGAGIGMPVGGVREIEDLRCTLDQMAGRVQSYQIGMHDYIAAITQGQEEERKRLARELHDDTIQALIALGQRVEMAQKALPGDPSTLPNAVVRMIAESLEGVRPSADPPAYRRSGTSPCAGDAARSEVRGAGEAGPDQRGPVAELSAVGPGSRLPPDMELAASHRTGGAQQRHPSCAGNPCLGRGPF